MGRLGRSALPARAAGWLLALSSLGGAAVSQQAPGQQASAADPAFLVDGSVALASLISLADAHLVKMADFLTVLASGEARSGRWATLTPPGSQCSIHFGRNGTPGSAQGLFLIVSDIQAARDDLVRRGVEVGEIFHYAAGPAPFGGQVSGLAPDHLSYGSYATFRDPDGNGWLLQEVTTRFPGRVAGETSYASGRELAGMVGRVHGARAVRRRTAKLNRCEVIEASPRVRERGLRFRRTRGPSSSARAGRPSWTTSAGTWRRRAEPRQDQSNSAA